MTIAQAYTQRSPAEITFDASVTSQPTYFFGSRTRCEHEQFEAQTPAGPVRIIDNVALAPRVAVRPGDAIRVRGELVHDRVGPPVVHWTHHDPQHRHADGFIELNGRVYA